MRYATEVLATSARTGEAVKCPFSEATKHPSSCRCMGSGKLKACQECGGAGWDGKNNRKCSRCGGQGAVVAS